MARPFLRSLHPISVPRFRIPSVEALQIVFFIFGRMDGIHSIAESNQHRRGIQNFLDSGVAMANRHRRDPDIGGGHNFPFFLSVPLRASCRKPRGAVVLKPTDPWL